KSRPTVAARPALRLSSGESPRPSPLISPRCPMPPRLVVAAVVVGWLATVGWLAHDKWLPWLRPSDEPAFVVEMADEVAPEHATWVLLRNGKKVGSAETRFAARRDGHFDMTTRLREVNLNLVQIPTFSTTRI